MLSFIYDNIYNKCNSKCKFHDELKENLSYLIIKNTVKLNTRIEILTKKSIRDRLLTYFNIVASKNFTKTIKLDISLTDLADYLCVDRSAMMREISHLKEDGIIEKNGKKITILIT